MAKVDELQKNHEAKLDELLRAIGGRSRESDWALVRALIHKAAERQGMTQAAFVASVLAKEAERIIRGDDSTAQFPTVVVNPRSVAEDARLARIEAALQSLTASRRRWWQFC